MSSPKRLEYAGHEYTEKEYKKYFKDYTYSPYFPSDELKEVVNLAIDLKRPLLIDGVPGCGKTELARAIAHEFTLEYLKPGEEWPWDIWNVKSTEQASDGLYTFDVISKLRDAQLAGAIDKLSIKEAETLLKRLQYDEKDTGNDKKQHPYLRIGKLGRLLSSEYTPPIRPILLIDEIDKANMDFPNDLLMELDKGEFEIKEIDDKFPKDRSKCPKPIIIIASNQERPLSDAFLRRCIYFHLDFPENLTKIIHGRFPSLKKNSVLSERIIETLTEVRNSLNKLSNSKVPGTSEVLDLVDRLQSLSEEDALTALDGLKNKSKKSPLLGILIKTKQAQDYYRNRSLSEE